MIDRMRFSPGETVVRRYFRGGYVTMAQAARVVSDDDAHLLLWVPRGSDFACRWHPDGTRLREAPLPVIADAPVRTTQWVDTDVLILVPPDADHSVWWFYRDGRFTHWYANLEAPSVRWRGPVSAGLDTVDHVLDLVVQPDLAWEWKDEEEFLASYGPWGYWDERTARRIRAAGDALVARIEAAAFPFDGVWRTPPSAVGPVPRLPRDERLWLDRPAPRSLAA